MKSINIDTIESYIKFINELEGDFFFRGESSVNYPDVIASAFRKYPVPFSTEKKNIEYKILLDNYYKELYANLTEVERNNFLFYAQHHGLPTPLIDVTNNPLVALYFACSSNYSEDSCRVHLYDKKKLIDISDFPNIESLTQNNFFGGSKENSELTVSILNKINESQSELKIELLSNTIKSLETQFFTHKVIEKYNEMNDLERIIAEVFRDSFNKTDNSSLKNEHIINELGSLIDIKIEKKETGVYSHIIFIKENNDPCFKFNSNTRFYNKDVWILGVLLNQSIRNVIYLYTDLKSPFFGQAKSLDFPMFSVIPKVSFDRLKTQDASFIYQVPIYKPNSTISFGYSKVKSDYVLEITNKRDMFKSLDKIGVNQKTIFPDPDNIAQHIKNKYLLD